MANKPKLRAGKGAKATILTKMIRPNNVAIPYEKHKSTIIITDRFEEKGKHRFLFHLDGVDETQLLNGSIRYVTIVSEGEPSLFLMSSKATTIIQPIITVMDQKFLNQRLVGQNQEQENYFIQM